jgi:DNA-binding LacI/PurR family transcriptional regulator
MAIAAMEVLREAGRRVPEDVAVVGYDNLSIAEVSNPPLTTVSQNLPVAGRQLARNLIQYLQTGGITNVLVPVELVIRKST